MPKPKYPKMEIPKQLHEDGCVNLLSRFIEDEYRKIVKPESQEEFDKAVNVLFGDALDSLMGEFKELDPIEIKVGLFRRILEHNKRSRRDVV